MPIMPFLNSILADVSESMYVIDGVPSVRSVNRISILFFAFYWLSSRVLRVKATQIQQPLTHDYISKPKEAAIRIWMRKNALFPRSLKGKRLLHKYNSYLVKPINLFSEIKWQFIWPKSIPNPQKRPLFAYYSLGFWTQKHHLIEMELRGRSLTSRHNW